MDSDNILAFKQKVESAIGICEVQKAQLCEKKEKYEFLKTRLETISHRLSYDIMVPISSVGFMQGKAVNTNKVTVLLGDNWFVDRSAFQAIEIADRRLKYIQKCIDEVQVEKDLLSGRLENCNIIQQEGGVVEIREEYDPEKERQWREARKAKRLAVRHQQLNLSPTREETETVSASEVNASETEQSAPPSNKYQRVVTNRQNLDELDSDDDDDDLSQSPELTDEEGEEGSGGEQPRKKSVHWEQEEDLKRLRIHSKPITSEDEEYSCLPKSILKNREEKSPCRPLPPEDPPQRKVVETSATAFSGTIMEHSLQTGTKSTPLEDTDSAVREDKNMNHVPAKPVSQFKQRRLKQSK